jgi:hypothetical protein
MFGLVDSQSASDVSLPSMSFGSLGACGGQSQAGSALHRKCKPAVFSWLIIAVYHSTLVHIISVDLVAAMAIKMTKDEKKISVDLTVPGTLSMHRAAPAPPARSAVVSTTCTPHNSRTPARPCSCRRAPRRPRAPPWPRQRACRQRSAARSAGLMSTRTVQHQDANVHAGCALSLASPLGRVHVDARHAARALRRGAPGTSCVQRSHGHVRRRRHGWDLRT